MPVEFDAAAVRAALTHWLAVQQAEEAVVWVQEGDEAVVWLDSVRVTLETGRIRVRVQMETEQTGRATQDVVLAVAEPEAPPSLVAVADDTARGDALLAARWGRTIQDAVWAALLDIAGLDAAGIAAADGTLVVHTRSSG